MIIETIDKERCLLFENSTVMNLDLIVVVPWISIITSLL